ncbi:hypothetical protein MtrunA17_Chr4g0066211 [Medicago truncatula]|uniref:Uncharacterized protein n=1 Tax=Medicago truncatula TaxID=3880 RepID=A0A396IF70_MEDTR|nr:hypothetical protein MtrunA17_Chr4g0066211 [Medicago truncatula]
MNLYVMTIATEHSFKTRIGPVGKSVRFTYWIGYAIDSLRIGVTRPEPVTRWVFLKRRGQYF